MVQYSCEKCGKTFKQKGHYTKHLQRKTPCDNIVNKIEKIVEDKVEEKLQQLLENGNNASINEEKLVEVTQEKLVGVTQEKQVEVTQEKHQKLLENGNNVLINEKDTPDGKHKYIFKSIMNKHDELDVLNENIITVHGCCLEKMKLIKDNSINLILCDLPYGTTRCKWDSVIDIDKLWLEYKRIIIKPIGVICLFGDQPFTSRLIAGNYEWFKYDITWYKNKTTQYLLANYRPMKCKEDIILFSPGGAAAASKKKGNMTYNPQGLLPKNVKKINSQKRIGKMLNQEHHLGKNNKLISNQPYEQKFTNYPKNIINFDIESNTKHETQKPVKLIEHLINTYSNENDIVLDNTMGSGTTCIGCINTKRKFIGMELNKEYYNMACERIMKHLEDNSPGPE